MQISPYLSFDGQCEAAFKFYEQCLGGQLGAIFRYAGTPLADQSDKPLLWKLLIFNFMTRNMVPIIRGLALLPRWYLSQAD